MPDWVASAEHEAGEGLVDDQHAAAVRADRVEVERREIASRDHRRAEGGKVARGYVHQRAGAEAVRGSAHRGIDLDAVLDLVLHRQPVGKRDGFHAGLRPEPLGHLVEPRARARRERARVDGFVLAVHRDVGDQVPVRADPVRSLLEPVRHGHRTGGKGHERHRERHLEHDRRGPQATESRRPARRPLAAQHIQHVGPREAQRRQDADNHRAEDRERRGVQQRLPRQARGDPERHHVPGGHQPHPPAQRELRHEQADDRRQRGQHERLDEELTDDAAASGAHRAAHGDLPAACGGPREHQRGDIRADDGEEHEEHGVRAVQDSR